jgi:Tol biopolymer transport system component
MAAGPRASALAAILSLGLLLAATGVAEGATAKTTRVSVRSNGDQGNGPSPDASISAGGRFVAFTSYGSNVVPGDTNGLQDVFVHDRAAGTTSRVSVRSNGHQATGDSYLPSISAGGRFVAFTSGASNLVPGDTNGMEDAFVHDRQTGTTRRVSLRSNGDQANHNSYLPSISADGRFVAFHSDASNLLPGDTNNKTDVFVHDRTTGTTRRVSVRSNGDQATGYSYAPAISGDGRFVAFYSNASNLVPGDTNGKTDVFVHDRKTAKTSRVSVRSNGHQANGDSFVPAISGNGRYVAFVSNATNLAPGDTNNRPDVFVHDRRTGKTSRVSVRSNGAQSDGYSIIASISADGRYVAFSSYASNLVPGDTNGKTDVFVHDRKTAKTARVSVRFNGHQANGDSFDPAISANGRYVAFPSYASNLVPGDTNGTSDVFVRGPLR